MIPIWLTLYLMCGACAGTFYASMAIFGLYYTGAPEWRGVVGVAFISLTLIVAWPLWAGWALLCWTLQKLGIIG